MGHKEPSSFGSGRPLEVFGETAASAEPGKCAFDNPATGQKLEAFDTLGPLDDLNCPRPAMSERFLKLVAAVDAIGKNVSQLGEPAAHPLQ